MKELIEAHFRANADRIEEDKVVRGRATLYANRRLKHWPDSEDCVQEAYCRALKYADGFKEGSDFDCWFFIILANVVNSTLYKRDISPEFISTDEEGVYEEEEPTYIPKDTSFLDRIESLDCTLREKSVLTFYYKYGHKIFNIAEILNLRPVVVRAILNRDWGFNS